MAISNGVITGRVIKDDGQPVAGAAVTIFAKAEQRRIFTDEKGEFKLAGMRDGFFKLMVGAPGYVMSDGPAMKPYRVGDYVTVNMIKGGVITGRVTDAQGEPIVGLSVFASNIRSLDGIRKGGGSSRRTDDRGVYRIFGLAPGIYIVGVKEIPSGGYSINYTQFEAPTYYPSATRDTAAEIIVHSSEEVTGIDLKTRGEKGRTISGRISIEGGWGSINPGASVNLYNPMTGEVAGSTWSRDGQSFSLKNISDGEYDLTAQSYSREPGESAVSNPQRVLVRGADVSGVELKLFKTASISGRLILEKSERKDLCKFQPQLFFEDVAIIARIDASAEPPNAQFEYLNNKRSYISNGDGEFVLRDLPPGYYRVDADSPDENWYVRSIVRQSPLKPANNSKKSLIDLSRRGIALKPGEKATSVEVVMTEGAASLRGRIVPVNGDGTKPDRKLISRWRVHLIPSEVALAENIPRYSETVASNDGLFEFKNLAPGKYWLHAKPIPESDTIEPGSIPLAWDLDERVKLRRAAETSKNEVVLQPCRRVNDYVLRVNLK
jgi:hypothetical protein